MPARIESAANPRIKVYRSLATTKGRREHGRFQLEGASLIAEALSAKVPLQAAYVCPERARDSQDLADALAEATEVVEVSEGVLEKMTSTVSPQGFAAEASVPQVTLSDVDTPDQCLLAVPVGTQDPGNLGTMIRTAHAVGAAALVALGQTADPYGPKVVRATAGSLFTLPVVRQADIGEFVGWCCERDVQLVGATVEARASLHETPLPPKTAALLGSERQGLPEELAGDDVLKVSIPMPGGAESLNVSVAAGVLMYEYRRQYPA